MAETLGLAVLCWSPQARGVLARASPGDLPAPLATTLAKVAGHHGVAAGAVAIAWLMSKGVFPVVGARDAGQLAPSLRAADLRLDGEAVASLDAAAAPPESDLPAILARLRDSLGLSEVTPSGGGPLL
jgi:aryl-alcohol dehydrogenase-like predicted oxidoreductase